MRLDRSSVLSVGLPGVPVGQLERDRHGLISWHPDSAWEAGGQRPRLGVAFLRKPGVRSTGSGFLPAWFENLLPERDSALRDRLCAVHQVAPGDGFNLLRAIGRNLAGAAEVTSPDEDVKTLATNATVGSDGGDPASEDDVAQRLRFSLAGMQLKFSMSMVSDRLRLGAVGRGSQWVVKLPGSNYTQLPEVEQATMTWAKNAGFDVPTHFVANTADLEGIPSAWTAAVPSAFAVQRFDRRGDGSKIHQEDLCQGLELFPNHKYGGQGARQVTYDSALRFVADIAGEDDAREMARRLGFVIASGNDDAHLKNWSLLWGNSDRPSLAPCYDLVATVSWADKHGWASPQSPCLALSLGGERQYAKLNRKVLSRHASKTGFGWAADEVLAGIQCSRDAWQATKDVMPDLMRSALKDHWRNVPLLSEMQPKW